MCARSDGSVARGSERTERATTRGRHDQSEARAQHDGRRSDSDGRPLMAGRRQPTKKAGAKPPHLSPEAPTTVAGRERSERGRRGGGRGATRAYKGASGADAPAGHRNVGAEARSARTSRRQSIKTRGSAERQSPHERWKRAAARTLPHGAISRLRYPLLEPSGKAVAPEGKPEAKPPQVKRSVASHEGGARAVSRRRGGAGAGEPPHSTSAGVASQRRAKGAGQRAAKRASPTAERSGAAGAGRQNAATSKRGTKASTRSPKGQACPRELFPTYEVIARA